VKLILYGVTAGISLSFYRAHARALRASGFEVAFLASPGLASREFALAEDVPVIELPMRREPSFLADLGALVRLTRVIRRLRPAITNFGTPKAGLLGNVAAFLCRVPCRVYTLHGLRLETARGWKRRLLTLSEKVACRCAHRVICVSTSLRGKTIEFGLVKPEKAVVVAGGTCNGVEAELFAPTPANLARAERLREALSLAPGVPVLGFVGRFTRDKGIGELLKAFRCLRQARPQLRLLLVGDFEDGDPVAPSVRAEIESDPNIIRPGFVADTSAYYHLMDVVALPTYREGFPVVPLEAQASGKPVVTTRATGAIDSVLDGKTGLMVPVGDPEALAKATGSLVDDPGRRAKMGRAGQEWVRREFSGERIRAALAEEYLGMLEAKAMRPAQETQGNTDASRQRGWGLGAKRALDIAGSLAGLVVLSPILFMVAALIRMSMGRPAIFRQIRPGKGGQPFTLLKFRTMAEARGPNGELLPDEVRLTGLGSFLRTASLDELPQLWNVLRGDLSLVGPRPLLMQYLPRYTAEQARRHNVLPGITGWCQVNGRNALSWEEKFALDVWYVDHWSMWLDIRILLATMWRVVQRSGISQPGHATMPEFMGQGQKGV
jgi:lipopolysaccharide/colanic/teichoic acid biosynthesis glycosyltransferase/glycosyltransferase involved in cell wall biosynthesis